MNYNKFRIIISASIPSIERSEEYRRIKDAQINIEESIVALARSVFNAGGTIIMGGHPSITPLLSMVATEFPIENKAEKTGAGGNKSFQDKPLIIFQSNAFREALPESTLILSNSNFAEVIWTDVVDDEIFDANKKGRQCEKSLTKMREEMVQTNANALVCIGGMEGVQEEFDLFSEKNPRKKIFLLKNTGGAAGIIAEESVRKNFVRIMDDSPVNEYIRTDSKSYQENLFTIYPYSFIASEIVEEITEGLNQQ